MIKREQGKQQTPASAAVSLTLTLVLPGSSRRAACD
jgi:hypothetical protein